MNFIDSVKNIFAVKNLSREINDLNQKAYNLQAQARWGAKYQNAIPWGGSNNSYELPPSFDYEPDYLELRAQAWGQFLKTDLVQNAINKYILWTIGAGLKLQSDPLVDSNIKENFVKEVEKNFRLYTDLKESTFNQVQNLHAYGGEILKTALLSGDVLCINRVDKYNNTSIEAIDGCFISTPLNKIGDKNIIEGVEIDDKGRHVAYWVEKDNLEHERIAAKGKRSGQVQAWLVYGLKYKLNGVRGMSLLSAVLETVDKIDRYKSASVGNAEENAKIPYTVEHDQFSTGENPLLQGTMVSMAKGSGTAPETQTQDADAIAMKIAATTEKQTFNMPIGAKLKRADYETDDNFVNFAGFNIDVVYATIGIPPEVALDKFGGSYSGSRAALKSWEYKMLVDRKTRLRDQFYQNFYIYWLNIQILSGKIRNDDYLSALINNDVMQLAAWRNSRFIGVTVPHIDPEKEVRAERLKLGSQFDGTPLTTGEQACENLNSGDYETVQTKTKIELKNTNTTINGTQTAG